MGIETNLFKMADAVKFIKAAKTGTRFCLHVRNDAPIEGEPDRVFPSGLSGYVRLSRAEAVRLAKDFMMPNLEARGARVPISVHRSTTAGRECVVYWLG